MYTTYFTTFSTLTKLSCVPAFREVFGKNHITKNFRSLGKDPIIKSYENFLKTFIRFDDISSFQLDREISFHEVSEIARFQGLRGETINADVAQMYVYLTIIVTAKLNFKRNVPL